MVLLLLPRKAKVRLSAYGLKKNSIYTTGEVIPFFIFPAQMWNEILFQFLFIAYFFKNRLEVVIPGINSFLKAKYLGNHELLKKNYKVEEIFT